MLKKYLYLVMMALMATMTFALTSCGSDDEDEADFLGRGKIEINGVTYRTGSVEYMGSMNSWDGTSIFCVTVDREEYIDTYVVDYYYFRFESDTKPRTGDDFSKMKLTLDPWNDSDFSSSDEYFTYRSGTAKVISADTARGEMTIAFNKLTMTKGSDSYTFNGTVTVPFEF